MSNTPLEQVLEHSGPREDMCIFQIDLFSAKGNLPDHLVEVPQREKEIRFSSRTRLNTDIFCELRPCGAPSASYGASSRPSSITTRIGTCSTS